MSLVLLLAVVPLAACGHDKSTGPAPTLAGRWVGTFSYGTMSMTLTQSGQVVSGSATMTGGGSSMNFGVSGYLHNPNLTLALTESGYYDVTLTGTLSGDKITGQLNDSGFSGETVALTRQ